MKPVAISRLAEQDIFDAIDYYSQEVPQIVERFMRSVDAAMSAIGRSPRTGSPAFAETLDIDGLRFRTIRSFPLAAFYQEFETEVLVLRVLHHGRDLMSLIGVTEGD